MRNRYSGTLRYGIAMINHARDSLTALGAALRPAIALAALSVSSVALAQQQPVLPLPSLAPMIDRASPAVVNISVKGSVAVDNPLLDDPLFRRFFDSEPDRRRDFQSAGSGVIVDAARGYILTNPHVVENAAEITITLFDSRSTQAQVVGSDAASDLAVLKVETNSLAEMPFADSSRLSVGDFVVAIDSSKKFDQAVTRGSTFCQTLD